MDASDVHEMRTTPNVARQSIIERDATLAMLRDAETRRNRAGAVDALDVLEGPGKTWRVMWEEVPRVARHPDPIIGRRRGQRAPARVDDTYWHHQAVDYATKREATRMLRRLRKLVRDHEWVRAPQLWHFDENTDAWTELTDGA